MSSFREALRAVLPAVRATVREGGTSLIPQQRLVGDLELIRRAVISLPNTSDIFPTRESYLAIGYALRAALRDHPDEAWALFQSWAARWRGGVNDPDVVDADWRRMKPPFRRGADWLLEMAGKHGDGSVNLGSKHFEPLTEALFAVNDERTPLSARYFTPAELDAIRPRQWLYGNKVSRGYVTMVVSPPGVGKSSWTFAVAIACAAARQLLRDKPHRALRSVVWGLEDDSLELGRRFNAAMLHYEVDRDAVTQSVSVNSGRDRRIRIVREEANGGFHIEPDYQAIIDLVRAERFDLIIVDPFRRSHSLAENDNDAQDEVLRLWSQIAEETSAGIVLVSHTRKGAVAGDLDSIRGGSAQGGAARSVLTLAPMSDVEAKKLGIPEDQRRLFVRIDDAKNNMAPPGSAEWMRLQSVSLANGNEEYPAGDRVQVAVDWAPPTIDDALADENGDTAARENEMLRLLQAGMPDGERYSLAPQAKNRWAGHALIEQLSCSEDQAKKMLAAWLRSGSIAIRGYHSPNARKDCTGIFVTRTDDIFG